MSKTNQDLEREVESLTAHLNKAKAALFVPGMWVCEDCGFTLSKSILSVSTGDIRVDRDETIEPCPNDQTRMVELTWQQYAEGLVKVAEEALPDKRRMDFIESTKKGYGSGWVFRESSNGRGMRLHETSAPDTAPTARGAIDLVQLQS